jgi:ferrous iron transport protein B
VNPALLAAPPRPVLLVGQPNVGKSALFNALTGGGAIVSNYPGTTVAVTRGRLRLSDGSTVPLKDTPGAYSLLPITEDERIARDCLFGERDAVVVHVVDGKNLERGLTKTLELLDAGLRVVVAFNMADECAGLGIRCDLARLAARLGCPVVPTVAVDGTGIAALRDAIQGALAQPTPDAPPGTLWRSEFGDGVDRLTAAIAADHRLPPALPLPVAAAMVLRGSQELAERAGLPEATVAGARAQLAAALGSPPAVAAALALRRRVDALLAGVYRRPPAADASFRARLGHWLAHPVVGLLPLAAVLYLGFYLLVGVFAAGTVVGWLEEGLFQAILLPALEPIVALLPWAALRELATGDYGLLTLGLTYALAVVLPVVGAFFLVFSVVEDSGYFPRLALLCDRLFKSVGLNGRAVITMVLGLGCATMATTTTRTLETRRERVLATLLLVLAVPCSAQLGLITGLLAARSFTLWLGYAGLLLLMFVAVGWITARFLPGPRSTFQMELVPMRLPSARHVVRKTWMRLRWYLREVVPLFLWASAILWALDQVGGIDAVRRATEPLMALIGMPAAAAESFVIGFFRRDFGAAGLFALAESGELATRLTDRQALTGAFTLTLFVPCFATFMMMWRERGRGVALAILGLVTLLAFAAGGGLNQVLLALGWA